MTGWFNEAIDHLPSGNWLYKVVCFCLGKRKRKMTYKEMYVMLWNLNKKSLGDDEAKKASLNKVLSIYKSLHNNELPKDIYEI